MDEKEIRKQLEIEKAKEAQHRKRAELLAKMLESSSTAKWPKEKLERLNAGLCLECGLPLGSDPKKINRGNHIACFHRTYRRIQQKEITQEDAEYKFGLLAPKKKSGRKRKNGQPPLSVQAQIAAETKSTYRKSKSNRTSRLPTDHPLNGTTN